MSIENITEALHEYIYGQQTQSDASEDEKRIINVKGKYKVKHNIQGSIQCSETTNDGYTESSPLKFELL